jgi:hypothetical protein
VLLFSSTARFRLLDIVYPVHSPSQPIENTIGAIGLYCIYGRSDHIVFPIATRAPISTVERPYDQRTNHVPGWRLLELPTVESPPRCPILRGLVSRAIRMSGIGVLATAAMAQTPRQQPPPSFEFSSGQSSLCIPAEVVADGLVLMQAAVNGHTGWFILDNASQGFTIDTEYARFNSLEFTDRTLARGGGASPIMRA